MTNPPDIAAIARTPTDHAEAIIEATCGHKFADYGEVIQAAILAAVQSAMESGARMGLDAAANACKENLIGFLDPAYATNQPVSSLMERFACGECLRSIEAITPASLMEPKP